MYSYTFDMMENTFEGLTPEAILELPKFQAIDILVGCFQSPEILDCDESETLTKDDASRLALSMELEISQGAWDYDTERMIKLLELFAQKIYQVFCALEDKFGLDLQTFIDTCAKDISFKMEG